MEETEHRIFLNLLNGKTFENLKSHQSTGLFFFLPSYFFSAADFIIPNLEREWNKKFLNFLREIDK